MVEMITLAPDVLTDVQEHERIALDIWKDAGVPYRADAVRIAAGNVAGYGAYCAHTHACVGVIEFPIGNAFSLLVLSGSELVYAESKQQTLGTFLHEMGHYVVHNSPAKPWKGMLHGKQSTHLRAEWLWICHKGWEHFHEGIASPLEMARCLKRNDGTSKLLTASLRHFSPFSRPPERKLIVEGETVKQCPQCNGLFEGRRSDAKFCSTRCRVAFNRERGNQPVNDGATE